MKPAPSAVRSRVQVLCNRLGLRVPILLAPMAGACPPALSVAVANAGGLGACGALLLSPDEILQWVERFRAGSAGVFQINTWIPDPPPRRDAEAEARVRAFLAQWGPPVAITAGDTTPPDFEAQCDAMLEARAPVVSSIMGLFTPDRVAQFKARGTAWLATVTTVAEARIAEAAGADGVIAQGMEAGGHRGSFDAAQAERSQVGLFALVPAVADAVRIPVIASGAIADARGIAAALTLGASGVQIGTGFLRCPEAGIAPVWAEALAHTAPEGTQLTRAFSGRAGRSLATDYVRAAGAAEAPLPAPYPVQRGLTTAMRALAAREGDLRAMQAWAGQGAALALAEPAQTLTTRLWAAAEECLI